MDVGLHLKKKNLPKCPFSSVGVQAEVKGGPQINLFMKAARLISPFSPVMDLFLSPCSSLFGPHLLPMSLSINDSARDALKCFHLSVSECSWLQTHYFTCVK